MSQFGVQAYYYFYNLIRELIIGFTCDSHSPSFYLILGLTLKMMFWTSKHLFCPVDKKIDRVVEIGDVLG